MNLERLVRHSNTKPNSCLSYWVFVVFLFITISHLNAQIPYLEIKNHRAQTATYGQIDLSKKSGIRKYSKFQIDLNKTDTFTIKKVASDLLDCPMNDDTLDILIYIHAMWGGADFFQSKILRTFTPKILSPNGSIDKILPIIWHAGIDYKKNLPKAYKIGELFAENIAYMMQGVKNGSEKPVRFHLLCHSMGHQVFRGIYKVNVEKDLFQFGDIIFENIIFAAPDADYDIFGKEWGGLPKEAERITYFVNKNDRALKISEKKLKIKRLGKAGSIVQMQDNVNEIDVSNIDDAKGLSPKYSGHGYFFASETVRGIIIRLLNN